jgi:adenylate kinase
MLSIMRDGRSGVTCLVLIGPPGSGKGTQAERLRLRYGIPHISTGDLLRQAIRDGSALGRRISAVVRGGGLVGDSLMIQIVRERISRDDARKGFLLDGFPRTLAQARAFDEFVPAPPVIIILDVPDEEIVRRLSRRRVCQSCQNSATVPAQSSVFGDQCEACGGRLIRRFDDEPATVRRRLETHHKVVAPVVEHYRPRGCVVTVDGLASVDAVTEAIVKAVDCRRGLVTPPTAS